MMIGTCEDARTWRQTSRPSIPGSITSSRIRSGRSLVTSCSARSPSSASTIRYPSRAKATASIRWIASSSSTTRMVAFCAGLALASTRSSLATPPAGAPYSPDACRAVPRPVIEPARHTGGRSLGRPATARRGARPAGPRPETLVNWSLYRLGWVPVLLCGLVVLIAAEAPATLRGGQLPQIFDGQRAVAEARLLVTQDADRSPGSGGSARAADTIDARLRAAQLSVSRQRFQGENAGGDSVPMENVIAVMRPAGLPRGPARAVFVLAHRDDVSPGPGANDDASGTALLLGLARIL